MKLKDVKRGLAALMLAGLGSTAFAQVYVGASAGTSDWDLDCDGMAVCNSPTSFKVFAGQRMSDGLAIEGSYTSLGTKRVGALRQVEFKGSAIEGASLFILPFNKKADGFLKVGLAAVTGKYTNAENNGYVLESGSKTSLQPVVGVGFMLHLNKHVAMRTEWESREVEIPGDHGTVSNWTLGLQFNF